MFGANVVAAIAADRLPALQALWDALVAHYTRLDRSIVTYRFDDYLLFVELRLRTRVLDPTTWTPRSSMRAFIEECNYSIEPRRNLLRRVISRVSSTDPSDTMLDDVLIAYNTWAETAVWETERPNLNIRMKQFMRQCGWLYFSDVAPPAPITPTAPTVPVVEPTPAPVEPIAEPIVEPIPTPVASVPTQDEDDYEDEEDELEGEWCNADGDLIYPDGTLWPEHHQRR